MKASNIRGAIALAAAVLSLHAYAGDMDDKKAIIPMEQPAASPWSLSIGVDVSSIKSTFTVDPGLLKSLFSDGGSTAIYNGDGIPLVYSNGTIGGPGDSNGLALFANRTGGMNIPSTLPNTSGGAYVFYGTSATAFANPSDTSTSVGPYIRLDRNVADFDSNTIHLSIFGQYTFTTTFDQATAPVAISQIATTYQTYSDGVNGIVYNEPQAFASGAIFATPAYAPSQSLVARQIAYVASGLNIDMHTFELGIDLSKDICERAHLIFLTGPTLNLFSTGLASIPVGLPIGQERSDDTTLRFGWDAQAGIQVDLDSHKRWFVEILGDYHWVTPFTVATPISSARVQASSWGGELGLGFRF